MEKTDKINLEKLKRICYHFAGAVAVGYDFNSGRTFEYAWKQWLKDGKIHEWGYHESTSKEVVKLSDLYPKPEPCPNCKELIDECGCMRNKCIKCGNPVGNITFTVCDNCWDKLEPSTEPDGWISVKERLPKIGEDGESDLVLCLGYKMSRIETVTYSLMKWIKLNKPDLKNSNGEWIEYGWSNRWWDTNPDYYNIHLWQPLPSPPKEKIND